MGYQGEIWTLPDSIQTVSPQDDLWGIQVGDTSSTGTQGFASKSQNISQSRYANGTRSNGINSRSAFTHASSGDTSLFSQTAFDSRYQSAGRPFENQFGNNSGSAKQQLNSHSSFASGSRGSTPSLYSQPPGFCSSSRESTPAFSPGPGYEQSSRGSGQNFNNIFLDINPDFDLSKCGIRYSESQRKGSAVPCTDADDCQAAYCCDDVNCEEVDAPKELCVSDDICFEENCQAEECPIEVVCVETCTKANCNAACQMALNCTGSGVCCCENQMACTGQCLQQGDLGTSKSAEQMMNSNYSSPADFYSMPSTGYIPQIQNHINQSYIRSMARTNPQNGLNAPSVQASMDSSKSAQNYMNNQMLHQSQLHSQNSFNAHVNGWGNSTVQSAGNGKDFYSFPETMCQWTDCNFQTADPCQFNIHIQQNHVVPQNQIACEWAGCGTMASPNSMLQHLLETHIQQVPYACQWQGCDTSFYGDSEAALYHIKNNHFQSPVLHCNWKSCGEEVHDVQNLQQHLQTQHKVIDESHSCDKHTMLPTPEPSPQHVDAMDIVKQETKEMPTANEERESTSPKPSGSTCRWVGADGNICGKTFEQRDLLMEHVKEEHVSKVPKIDNGFCCGWEGCDRGTQPFQQRGKLDRHMLTHVEYKIVSCIKCKKDFNNIPAFEQHYRTHTGEKPFVCKLCNQSFAQGSALTMHLRIHTGERPLVCPYPGCGKTFAESSNLSKHRKIHNPVGLHKCPYPGCEKSFHRMDQYKRHFRTHRGAPLMSPLRNEEALKTKV